jgi:FkbM family methyltransferase
MLDRPLGRPILSICGSFYRTVAFRRLAFVWHRNRQWIHKSPEGYLVERQIMLHPLKHFHALNTDTYLYSYRLRPGDVVVDCGAYTGWETLLFSGLVGAAGRVVAIEAHPVSFECLTEMCRRNRLTNVVPLQCAASDLDGTIHITDMGRHQANTIVTGQGAIAVQARTLDEIVQQLGIKRIDLIKMNIEGAEVSAFRGAAQTLGITRHIAVSCHDWFVDVGGPAMRTKAEVRRLLENAGFEITTRSEDPRSWIRDFLYADRV